MAKTSTSIRINGKDYDALTGQLLSTSNNSAVKPVRRSIDGVVGGHTTQQPLARPRVKTTASTLKPIPASQAHATPKKVRPDVSRPVAPHAKAHHTTSSATLMRHAVSKPTTTSLKRRAKVQSHTHTASHLATTSSIVVQPKISLNGINHDRAHRAAQISLSPKISRFTQQVASAAERDFTAFSNALVIPKQSAIPTVVTYRPNVKPTTPRTTTDIFEQALLRATAHEEPAPVIPTSKKGRALRRRMVSFAAGAVVVLALSVGVFGFHAKDTIQLKLAANRAGFAATLPSYKPNGFSVADITSRSGLFRVRYASTDGLNGVGRSFALSEKPVDWTSSDLSDNLANSAHGSTFSTIEKAGRTVYIYGQNQAAWVSNGVLYQILGNGALSTQDFVQIATSM